MLLSQKEKKLLEKYDSVTGIDEVGRGTLAGPVLVASYTLTKQTRIYDTVNDSKKLTKNKREELYNKLTTDKNVYHIGISSNLIIDKYGIVYAIQQSMNYCIKKSNPHYILIDGIFKEKFDTEKKYETIIKGDTKIYCIAAASIIAKVTRDKIMERLSLKYENFDFQSNKGYGTKFHIQQLKTLGPTDIHRLSFIKNII